MRSVVPKRLYLAGFTLIELLVALAIVSILAAVLFPAFASAREAGRKAQCASNLRQVGLAFQQYMQDYDQTTPTVDKTVPVPPLPIEIDQTATATYYPYWYVIIQPYVKNWNVFICPDRTAYFTASDIASVNAQTDPSNCYDNYNPTGQCFGIGYNDGFVSDGGLGLLQAQTKDPLMATLRAGRSSAQIQSESSMVAFIDTDDNRGYSGAADNLGASLPQSNPGNAPMSTSRLRHGGRYNVCFVDGHVRPIAMISAQSTLAWKNGAHSLIIPMNRDDALAWCADPSPSSGLVSGYNDGVTNTNPKSSPIASYPISSKTNLNCYNEVSDVYGHIAYNP
jgi:prepilin-type N-terminal cleavage/methylation domain-containing protein/prepilin-type processing-associated H-X9-DG protein